ncbi:MFS transporter [Streptomyces profundus]|uniref:MFS transporter n=1 Tax=Streptomyces profundus TaxID=2867410 RepID=UPI001D168AAC|nr:MFS transporter [Streptomyces sp. MA3_2.13]UED86562.1 MFS transporter [Streptomyces sp. MA3_2.13]
MSSRNVPQLLLSASLSRLAHGMLIFVVVLYAIDEFDSAVVAGLSGFFLTFPGFLVSPVAGAVLDRFGALRAVAFDMVASAFFMSAIVTLAVSGAMTPTLLYIMLGLLSVTRPMTDGGIRTLFPKFVPDEALDRANALDLSSYSVIDVGAPLVAGVLFVWGGANPTFAVVAGMYVLAAVSLFLLRGATGPQVREGKPGNLLRSAWEGVAYLVRHATLRGLAVSYSLFQVTGGMLIIIVPVAVTEWVTDGGEPGAYVGVIWAVVGLCGGLGALAAGRIVTAGSERRVMGLTLVLGAFAVFPFSALGSLVALLSGLAVFGLLEGMVNVSLLSLRQRRTPPEWLGRIMTVSISVNLVGYPIGTALGGALVATAGPGAALAVAAAITLASALFVRLLIPQEV